MNEVSKEEIQYWEHKNTREEEVHHLWKNHYIKEGDLRYAKLLLEKETAKLAVEFHQLEIKKATTMLEKIKKEFELWMKQRGFK